MTFRKKLLVAAVVSLIVAIPVVSIGVADRSRSEFAANFAEIQPGQSRALVLRRLGEPGAIEECTGPSYSNQKVLVGECFQNLRYTRFMEVWGVIVDKDGNVLLTYHNVSP